MIYCKIQNDQISQPAKLPKLLLNVLNAEKLSESELNEKNIFRYQVPEFDPIVQKTGSLVFDEANNVVTREVIDKTFDIQTEKDKKIRQIQDYISSLLASTDKYFIRKQERDIDIPTEVQKERYFIHSESDRMKNEVQAFTDVKNVLTYNINIPDLKYHTRNGD